MAALVDPLCSWCRSADWLFRCSTCDPRQEKKLCSNCSMLWHSRGFAGSHQLTSTDGKTRTFLAWTQASSVVNGNPSTIIKPHSGFGRFRLKDHKVDVNSGEDLLPAAMEGEEMKPDSPATVNDNEFEKIKSKYKNTNERQSSEEGCELEKNKRNIEANLSSAHHAPAASTIPASGTTLASGNTASELEQRQSSSEHEKLTQLRSSPLNSTSLAAASATSMPVPKEALTVSRNALTPDVAYESTNASTIQQNAKTSPRSPAVNLDKLLRWFPTPDYVLMEMLAARIEDALAIEDALICARIGNCQEPRCRSVLLHYEHCKRDEMCGYSKCSEISTIYIHRRQCASKLKLEGRKLVCPFCIRIQQRRSSGVYAALDHLISDQRRALQNAQSEATRNFYLQSINRWTERQQPLRAESDRLNQLASESSVPTFNFPKYQWHFNDNVLIKEETTSVKTNGERTTNLSAAEGCEDRTLATKSAEQLFEGDDDESVALDKDRSAKQSQDTQDESIPGTATYKADYINQLLRIKSKGGENGETAQREFDKKLELGYAIVDASFCAPSKAQRCLLKCMLILDHLQHHLDLKVCNQPMCRAVEHHFAHLSDCDAHAQTTRCEYCLRMDERRLIRFIDFMEVEQQPEAEAKLQTIIHDMTASFTNHCPDEREQEMIQLEDELDQAEANKHNLLEKLGTGRSELRKVRRSMELRGISIVSSHQLPLHFTKNRRGFELGGNKKRRYADVESSVK